MNTLHWGFKSDDAQNKKRNNEESDEYEERMDNKKIKLFKEENKMIYSINKEIHFTTGINNESIETLIKKITKIINKNIGEYEGGTEKLNITLVIDSPGGGVTAILKFVDFIKMSKAKYPCLEFTSVLTGLCASAATIMCVACDHRYMTPNAHAMLHELSSGREGKYVHLMSYSNFLTSLHETLVNIYLEKCNKTKEELEKLLMKETWFNAKEYMEAGFVEKIISV